MVLADYLDDVRVVGPLGDHDGAVDVAYPRLVGDDVAEAAAVVSESVYRHPRHALDDVELPDVVRVHMDVQGAFEGLEPELGLELLKVAGLADVVAALAHPGLHRAVDGDVVRELEDPAVLVVLLAQVVYPLLGQLDALPAGSQVPDDVLLLQELQNPLGGRLLAHLERFAELPRGDGDVIVHGSKQGELPECEGVLLVHERTDAMIR